MTKTGKKVVLKEDKSAEREKGTLKERQPAGRCKRKENKKSRNIVTLVQGHCRRQHRARGKALNIASDGMHERDEGQCDTDVDWDRIRPCFTHSHSFVLSPSFQRRPTLRNLSKMEGLAN